MKCDSCGITIPKQPEDATYDMLLCDGCYRTHSSEFDSVCEVCGEPCQYDHNLCLCEVCEKKARLVMRDTEHYMYPQLFVLLCDELGIETDDIEESEQEFAQQYALDSIVPGICRDCQGIQSRRFDRSSGCLFCEPKTA